jgi:putative IMPACT (imprinted ancient) family translation regulator
LIERTHDAGEPKGTAGLPILREIKRRDLTDTLVMVIRYFGGTKLGTGNLARAYADCASLALDHAVVAEKRLMARLVVECPYELQAVVYQAAQKCHAKALPSSSDTTVRLRISVPAGLASELSKILSEEGRGRIRIHSEEQ